MVAVMGQTSASAQLRPSPIAVAIVHSNTLMREGLAALLARQPEIMLAASYADLFDARSQTAADVLLMSLGAKDMASADVVALASSSTSRIIVLAPSAALADIAWLELAGVYALVLDEASPDELLGAIRSVADGVRVWPAATVKALLSRVASSQSVREQPVPLVDDRMTRREREVLTLIADGLSTKEMARTLGIATFTVRTHVRNILEKLNLHSRLQIAAHVLRQQRGCPAPVVK